MDFEAPLVLYIPHTWYLLALGVAGYIFVTRLFLYPLFDRLTERVFLKLKAGQPRTYASFKKLNRKLKAIQSRYSLPEFMVVGINSPSVCWAAADMEVEPREVVVPIESLSKITALDVFMISHELGHIKSLDGNRLARASLYPMTALASLSAGFFLFLLPLLLVFFPQLANPLILPAGIAFGVGWLSILVQEFVADYWALRFLHDMKLLNRRTAPRVLLFAFIGLVSYALFGVYTQLDGLVSVYYDLEETLRRRRARRNRRERLEKTESVAYNR